MGRSVGQWIYYVLPPHKGLALNTADIQDLTEVRNMLAKNLDQADARIFECWALPLLDADSLEDVFK